MSTDFYLKCHNTTILFFVQQYFWRRFFHVNKLLHTLLSLMTNKYFLVVLHNAGEGSLP